MKIVHVLTKQRTQLFNFGTSVFVADNIMVGHAVELNEDDLQSRHEHVQQYRKRLNTLIDAHLTTPRMRI